MMQSQLPKCGKICDNKRPIFSHTKKSGNDIHANNLVTTRKKSVSLVVMSQWIILPLTFTWNFFESWIFLFSFSFTLDFLPLLCAWKNDQEPRIAIIFPCAEKCQIIHCHCEYHTEFPMHSFRCSYTVGIAGVDNEIWRSCLHHHLLDHVPHPWNANALAWNDNWSILCSVSIQTIQESLPGKWNPFLCPVS